MIDGDPGPDLERIVLDTDVRLGVGIGTKATGGIVTSGGAVGAGVGTDEGGMEMIGGVDAVVAVAGIAVETVGEGKEMEKGTKTSQ